MKLRILKLHPNAQVPQYATPGAACFDLHALTVAGEASEDTLVDHGSPITCATGLAFEVPEGYALMIYSRSGHGFKHGLRLANCVGVIDSDYRGEVLVKLAQDLVYDPAFNAPGTRIKPGDRIAQAMLVPVPRVEFEVAEQLTITERGANGLGSTGQGGAA